MPRRRRPEAHEGADGLWHVWVTVGTKPNGRPDQRHIKRKTKDDAEDRAEELLSQAKTGAPPRPGRAPSTQAWFETYFDTVAPRRCDPTTIKGYRSKARCYIYPVLGKVRVDRQQPEDWDRVFVTMDDAGRADTNQLQVYRIAKRAMEIARRRGLTPRNVLALIDPPSARKKEMDSPTIEAAGRLLGAAERRRTSARWKVGMGLGLRQGEALGLRWSYVDLDSDEPCLRVFWQLHRRAFDHGCGGTCGRRRAGNCPQRKLPLRSGEIQLRGGLILKPPKGKSKRIVPLPPELVAVLRAHREIQDLEKMMAGDAYEDLDLVFAQLGGWPIDPSTDWDEWQELEAEAGVEGMFRLHEGTRHFAASFLLALGVDIRVVQEILGHSSIKVTEGYAHVASKLAMDAVKKMGKTLLGG